MAELTPRERLQPSLLDRLTDDKPEASQESRDQRVLSMQQYRNAVLRDLSWLMNTSNHFSSYDKELKDYPEVLRSVYNFGIPDYTGIMSSSVEAVEIERAILQAIRDFEPRILRNSLTIRALVPEDESNPTALVFEIEGDLWSQPFPEALYIKTEVDLETGQCKVESRTNG